MGLPESEARQQLESDGYTVRVLAADGPSTLAAVRVIGRVNLVVRDGKVVNAYLG